MRRRASAAPLAVDGLSNGRHHTDVQRARAMAPIVLAALCAVTTARGAAFLERVQQCEGIRQPTAARSGCCALAGMERITREGGDCCKTLSLADTDWAGETHAEQRVFAPAFIARFVLAVVRADRHTATTRPRGARAPPPWRPTDTVRLLV